MARMALRSNRSFVAQRGNFLPGVAELEQDFLGMLSHLGRERRLSSHFAVERNGRTRDEYAPGGRMVEFLEVSVDVRLLVVEQHPVVRDFGDQDVYGGQFLEPLPGGFVRKDSVENLDHFPAVEVARRIVELRL